jgi:D-alanyl-lipoteichoic acid acyltransferase DltB (MBOAT superfamily)
VFWGGLHGAGLAFERARLWRRSRALLTQAASGSPATTVDGEGLPASPVATGRVTPTARLWTGRVVAWVVTFNFVCLGWIFFRATSFANAGQVLSQIFSVGPHVPLNPMVVLIVLLALVVQWIPARRSAIFQQAFARWSITAQALALAGVLVVIDAFGPAGVAPFIYFRF